MATRMAETSLVYLHEVKACKEQQAWGVHKGRSTTTWPKVTTGNRVVGFFTAGHSVTQQPTWSQISRISWEFIARSIKRLKCTSSSWTAIKVHIPHKRCINRTGKRKKITQTQLFMRSLHLRVSLPKTGPLRFGSENQFPLNFAHEYILVQK